MAETLGPTLEKFESRLEKEKTESLDTIGGLHFEHGKDEKGKEYFSATLIKTPAEGSKPARWWKAKAEQIEQVNQKSVDKVNPQEVLDAFAEKIFKTPEKKGKKIGIRKVVEEATQDEEAEKLLIGILDNNFSATENAIRNNIELYGLNISPDARSQIQKLG